MLLFTRVHCFEFLLMTSFQARAPDYRTLPDKTKRHCLGFPMLGRLQGRTCIKYVKMIHHGWIHSAGSSLSGHTIKSPNNRAE